MKLSHLAALRKYNDHATPDDRLRHCEGETEEYMAGKETSVDVFTWITVLLALAIIAWAIWGG